jgi:uncharacterized protein (TIGR03118 family)
MSLLQRPHRGFAVIAVAATGLTLAAPNVAAADDGHHGEHDNHQGLGVQQVNLVSDLGTVGASVVDPDVKNPWGLALGPTTPLWSANNGTSSATLYGSAPGSTSASLVSAVRVTVPLPTGQVFNGTTSFVLNSAGKTGPARFIFSTLTGQIAAWSNVVDPLKGAAEIKATVSGAVYTGLALATAKSRPQLYAANFAQGTVDAFDSTFTRLTLPANRFHDRRLPMGYAPFGIRSLQGSIFVAYAKVDPVTHRNAVGVGLGFVDQYSPDGRLLERVASRHTLNAPWGMEIAPESWGRLAGDLLIGNFGDGRINVIRGEDDREFEGDFRGLLRNAATGDTLVIPGLWTLLRGTDPTPSSAANPAGSPGTGGADSIWFSAGINNEQDGLIGVLRAP